MTSEITKTLISIKTTSEEVEHNENAQWIKEQEQECKELIQMEWKELTVEELRSNVTRTANWKLPGPDKIPSIWIKQFTSLHQSIASASSKVLKILSTLQNS